MIKHYIEWFYPGTFVSETQGSEVATRDAPAVRPEAAYGYRFYSRSEVELEGEQLVGARKDISPMTFYGEEFTLEQVRALPEDRPGQNSILISNMSGNGYERAVRTVRGNWQFLEPGDTVVPG